MPAQLEAVDVQEKFIEILKANAELTTHIANSMISDDDPTAVSMVENCRIGVVLAGEGDDDATLGGTGGTSIEVYYIAVMLYLYDSQRSREKKIEISRISKLIRDIVKMNRAKTATDGRELWYLTKFRQPATTYHSTSVFRQSVTYVEFYTRKRNYRY